MIIHIFDMDDETKKYIDDKIQEITTKNNNNYNLLFEDIKNIIDELLKLRKMIRKLEHTKKGF